MIRYTIAPLVWTSDHPQRARAEMSRHLEMTRQAQAAEEMSQMVTPSQLVESEFGS